MPGERKGGVVVCKKVSEIWGGCGAGALDDFSSIKTGRVLCTDSTPLVLSVCVFCFGLSGPHHDRVLRFPPVEINVISHRAEKGRDVISCSTLINAPDLWLKRRRLSSKGGTYLRGLNFFRWGVSRRPSVRPADGIE